MYLTIYISKTEIQTINFEDVLNNPFQEIKPIIKDPIKKTLIVSDSYARSLYEKNNKQRYSLLMYLPLLPYSEIPNYYTHFKIPKKSDPNKLREIAAPTGVLKTTQELIKNFIEQHQVQCHDTAFAYTEGRDTVRALKRHQENRSRWFLQIDLKDFFPSINSKFLKRQLMQIYPFPFFPENTIEPIIEYSLLNDSMPQGTCLSPILSNLVMVPIDHKITERLRQFKRRFVYTRYADDITISCREKFDYNEIINLIKEIFSEEEAPFTINESKTRFGSNAGKNYHLGIILNKDNQLSIGHEKNAKFRAMLYNWCKDISTVDTTDYEFVKRTHKMLGLISYYKNIEPEYIRKTINKYNKKFNIDIEKEAKEIIQ